MSIARRHLPLLAGFALAGAAGPTPAAEAEAVALYARFVAAQNAHDFEGVRAILVGEEFLWVSNGLTLRGPDAMIARLMRFHRNEVWRIDPDAIRLGSIGVTADVALVHVPLVLTVGPRAEPQRFHILVTAVCVRREAGWRIAALLTTDENTSGG
jgi:ketosteroid isomerase-like protein